MLYKCWFPGCEYETFHRSKIDYHHITPREIDPKSRITVPLCKTCHSLIYHPLVLYGQHSIKTELSIEILGVFDTTTGKAIKYKNNKDEIIYYCPFSKAEWKI
jgi:hypothetical protein